MTRERPIIFSAPMVRAILEGRKSQTRRIVKPQPSTTSDNGYTTKWNGIIELSTSAFEKFGPSKMANFCPYGQPGDRLWVRERHSFNEVTKLERPRDWHQEWDVEVEYSDGAERGFTVCEKPKQTRERGEQGWRSPIHMPRWASRITLEIIDVRAERLQDISEADARAEGVTLTVRENGALEPYRQLWRSINGPDSWDANPWVWVIEFRRVTP